MHKKLDIFFRFEAIAAELNVLLSFDDWEFGPLVFKCCAMELSVTFLFLQMAMHKKLNVFFNFQAIAAEFNVMLSFDDWDFGPLVFKCRAMELWVTFSCRTYATNKCLCWCLMILGMNVLFSWED